MIEIIPATEDHAREIARALRDKDRREITCLRLDAIHAVWNSWRQAVLARSILIDGELGAMWGVGGVFLGQVGRPWFVTTAVTERLSAFTFARLYREQVKEMTRMFPLLENYVDSSYHSAVRLLELSGFSLDSPIPFGPDKALFRRFWMRGK